MLIFHVIYVHPDRMETPAPPQPLLMPKSQRVTHFKGLPDKVPITGADDIEPSGSSWALVYFLNGEKSTLKSISGMGGGREIPHQSGGKRSGRTSLDWTLGVQYQREHYPARLGLPQAPASRTDGPLGSVHGNGATGPVEINPSLRERGENSL